MSTLVVTLPWPDKALSPNSRTFRYARNTIGQSAKQEAFVLTRQAMKGQPWPEMFANLSITFVQPNNRRHDLDNLLSRMKYALDGVSAGLQVDDHNFCLALRRTVEKGAGCVRIEISA